MRDSVWAHPTARELLSGAGINEASLVWVDGETGLLCKARLDRLTTLGDWPVILDVKTAKSASRAAFSSAVHKFHYHQQLAHYSDGAQALAPMDRKCMFIVVETERPFCVAVYELEDDALVLGRDETHKHLRAYAECLKTGRWPGYPDGADYISLPPWAFRAIEGGGE